MLALIKIDESKGNFSQFNEKDSKFGYGACVHNYIVTQEQGVKNENMQKIFNVGKSQRFSYV